MGAAPQGAILHQLVPAHGAACDGIQHWGTLRPQRWDTGRALGGRTPVPKPRQEQEWGAPALWSLQPPCHPSQASLTLQEEASVGLGREVPLLDFPAHPIPVWGEEEVVRTGWGGSSPGPCPPHLPGHIWDLFPWDFSPQGDAAKGCPRAPWRHSERCRAQKPAESEEFLPPPCSSEPGSAPQTPPGRGKVPKDVLKIPLLSHAVAGVA